MNRYLLLGLAAVLAISLIGCDSNQKAEETALGTYAPNQRESAYAYTHGGYVGKAEVTVNADGELAVDLDEAFLPHTLGLVDIESDTWNEGNTTSYVSRGNTNYVAKYVSYNDKVYVSIPTGTGFSYVEADESGSASGGLDLEKAILRNQGTMAAYFALISAGKFGVIAEFGGDVIPVTTTSYGGVNKKNAPGYWADGLGWRGNMDAIQTFAMENGVQFSLTEMVRAENENDKGLKPWSVADVVTGATNSDFKDYFGLVQAAAGRLKTN